MMEASYITKTASVLPTEILEAILDRLLPDQQMFSTCSLVCLDWLIRSRCHAFSTVQLSPWRARRFFELCRTKHCTFVNYVTFIDVNGAHTSEGNQGNPLSDDLECQFHQILFSSSLFLTHIKSLRVRNVNWTLLPFSDQIQLRQHLASFAELRTLEFDNVIFHDLREIVRVTSSFPSLTHLVLGVKFSKYPEHAISSAGALTLPNNLEVMRLETYEAIPVLLNTTFKSSRIRRLILDGVKLWHLQCVGRGLQNLRETLQHLQINFSRSRNHSVSADDLAGLDFTHHTNLRLLQFEGIVLNHQAISCTIERGSIHLMIQPTRNKVEQVSLNLAVKPEPLIRQVSWYALKRALVAKMPRHLNLDVSTCNSSTGSEIATDAVVEKHMYNDLELLQRVGICGNDRTIG